MASIGKLVFFLGGHDLEMTTIRDLLEKYTPGRFHDKGLYWGAKVSDYGREIEAAIAMGETPVLVELTVDMELKPDSVIIIDHHGKGAGFDKPTSLHQVFDILNLSGEVWTRWFDLVAANDRGYIPAMIRAGAALDEIAAIRAADRVAQGITPEEESEGERAAARAEVLAGGMLTIVRLGHIRTAAVADCMEPALGGLGYKNLLVISPMQVNFFGAGNLVLALNEAFPGGWYGGALPERGFWGHGEPVPDAATFLLDELRAA